MNDKETNFLTPILSAVAGVGTIVASLLPIFTPNQVLERIFVNPSSLNYLSILGFLVSVLFLWLFASPLSASMLFKNNTNNVVIRFRGLLLFFSAAMGLYITYVLAANKVLSNGVADVVQSTLYVSALALLSSVIGMLFRDTYENYRWQNESSHKVQNLKEAILESGNVEIDLTIVSMGNHAWQQNEPTDWINTTEVIFRTDNKLYRAVVGTRPKAVLLCEEAQGSTPQNAEDANQ